MAQPATQAPADSQLLNLRVPPHSIDAEQSVLGGLLIDNGAFDKIGDMVVEGDFYRDDHRRIFRHIARLIEKGKPADVVTVDESVKAGEDKDMTGVPTGFADLDLWTSGLQPGDLIIIAGRPSMGKTALALNMAEHVAVENKLPVAVFSMEMSGSQLAMRMLGSIGRLDQHKLRTGRLSDDDWNR